MLYRVKTKKEFIEEFGADWRNSVGFYFVHGMDYLLGKTLRDYKVEYNRKGEIYALYVTDKISKSLEWQLSTLMLVPVRKEKLRTIMKRIE